MVKRKAFVQIQSINIIYPNVENMGRSASSKKNGDYSDHASSSHFADEH